MSFKYTIIPSLSEETAKHLDEILAWLVDEKKDINSVEDIHQKIFLDKSYEYCSSLFYVLIEYRPKLLYPEVNINEEMFWATDYVSVFLHGGGFTRIFEKASEKYYAEKEKEDLNLEKLKYDVKNSKRIFKTYWWTFAISVSALLMALFNLNWNFLVN